MVDRRDAARRFIPPLFFLILAVLLTWPLPLHLDSIVLPQHHPDPPRWSDTRTHIAFMQDGAARLRNATSPLVVKPNYAMPQTFVLSAGAAVAFLGTDPVTAYNLFFLVSLALAGLFTYWLARHLGADPPVALLSGVLYTASFYTFHAYTYGHTNGWQVQWFPLAFLAVERLWDDRSWANTALLGTSFALIVLTSAQYAVYLSVLLPLYLVARYRIDQPSRPDVVGFAQRFAAAAGIGALLSAPYLLERLRLAGATATMSLEENLVLDRILSSPLELFYTPVDAFQVALRGGLLLAAAGVIAHRWDDYRALRPWMLLYTAAILLAVGPIPVIGPYYWLYHLYPVVQYFRVPFRVFPLALLAYSLVVPLVLGDLREHVPDRYRGTAGWAAVGAITLVQLLVLHNALGFHVYAL